jgi:hypothetical protein
MRTRYLLALVVALALGAAALGASRGTALKPKPVGLLTTTKPPDPPSALQRAEVQNDMKQLQLYQAQVQILNYQFDQTKAALAQKLKALEREGWDLNLETWQYMPKGTALPSK